MEKPSEQELFNALKRGSETAFKEVYQNNRSLFLNFARKFGLGDDDILDIVMAAVAVPTVVVSGTDAIRSSSFSFDWVKLEIVTIAVAVPVDWRLAEAGAKSSCCCEEYDEIDFVYHGSDISMA